MGGCSTFCRNISSMASRRKNICRRRRRDTRTIRELPLVHVTDVRTSSARWTEHISSERTYGRLWCRASGIRRRMTRVEVHLRRKCGWVSRII
jgi:hypothetical protein